MACVGPAGPQGKTGPPRQGIIIERRLSPSLYDVNGFIDIEDDRITPTTFQALYLKFNLSTGHNLYIPLEYLLVLMSTHIPSEVMQAATVPILYLGEGESGIMIADLYKTILFAAESLTESWESYFEIDNVRLAILVSP